MTFEESNDAAFEPTGTGGGHDLTQDEAEARRTELQAACELHAREVVVDVFDQLEDRIVAYYANLKTSIARSIAELEHMDPKRYDSTKTDIVILRTVAEGVAMLAHHVGYLSETQFHGAPRRRLATLTLSDLPEMPARRVS